MTPSDTKMLYWDSSALSKLVVAEVESDAIIAFRSATKEFDHTSSVLAWVEVGRVAEAHGDQSLASLALSGLIQIPLTPEIVAQAARLQPLTLRSLDAIHIASALALQGALEAMVTYDARMAEAARQAGLTVVSPGAA